MKDRPARPAVPPMPDWADLDQMHARILEQIDQLNALLAHLDTYGLDSQAQRSAIMPPLDIPVAYTPDRSG